MTSISTLTRDSIAAFDHAIAHFNDPEALVLLLQFKDERGRLNVWASNVGARQQASSSASLDYRLRHAPLMRAGIIRGLERVKRLVTRIFAILNGDAPNRPLSSPADDTGQEPQADKVKPRELDELVRRTRDAVSHLFGLSILLRRQRPRGRQPTANSLTLFEEHRAESGDISNIIDLFPKTKTSQWLARRLGNATTHRRDYIRYRQDHRASLGKASQDAAQSDDSQTVNQSVVATTFQESENEYAALQEPGSIFSTATSLASVGENDDIRRLIPDLSDMKVEGVQLQYDQPFECPYCRNNQQVRNRYEWKRHVITDLQPYVCTFKDCEESTTLFSTRAEWFAHEMATHRKLWRCNLCPALEQPVSSATDLKSHILGTHRGEVTEAQVAVLVKACEHPIRTFGPSSCPLCEEWEPVSSELNARSFSQHLARHLLQIALAALPLSIEGLEVGDHEEPWAPSETEEDVNVSGEEETKYAEEAEDEEESEDEEEAKDKEEAEKEEDSKSESSPADTDTKEPEARSQPSNFNEEKAYGTYSRAKDAKSDGKSRTNLWICHNCNNNITFDLTYTKACLSCSHTICKSCLAWTQ